MKQPTLGEFGLNEGLVSQARESHEREEKLFERLCVGWIVFLIVAGLFWGFLHPTRLFGVIQWGALGFIAGIFTVWLVAGVILPYLIPRVFSFHRFYSPILRKHDEYTQACREYEDLLEQERVHAWKEEEERRKQHEEFWFGFDGHAFEHELAKLLRSIGWQAQVTPGTNDKGIDIFAEHDGERYGIQCKAHRNPVGPAVVRELLGAAIAAGCDSSILVALGGVTSGARTFADDQTIQVWTVQDVIRLHADSR